MGLWLFILVIDLVIWWLWIEFAASGLEVGTSEFIRKTFQAAQLKSIHFKKTVARILFLSKLWYFLF